MQSITQANAENKKKYYWVLFLGILLFTLWAFWISHGGEFLRRGTPDGQELYLASKLMGLVAFVLLCWQVVMALMSYVFPLPSMLRAGRNTHIALGLTMMGFMLLHAGFFVAAVSVRSGKSALHLLLPDFTSGYYAAAVSLGVIALLLVLISVGVAVVRNRVPRVWKYWHGLALIATILVFIHAYAIGSELNALAFQPVYWIAVCVFGVACIARLKADS